MRNFPNKAVFPCRTKVTQQLENQRLLLETGLCFEAGPRGAAHYNVAKLFKVSHLMFPLIVSGRIRVHHVKPNEVCLQVPFADRPT